MAIIEDNGFIAFAEKLFKYIAARIFTIRRVIIFELDLEEPVKKVDCQIKVSLRLASKNDIESMNKEDFDYDQKGKKHSRERLKRGDRCILALHNDQIIGYVWVMEGQMELSIDNLVPLPKNKAYVYKGFVAEQYRGKRVLNYLDKFLIEELKKEHKKCLLKTVDINNTQAVKASVRMGFKKAGNVIQFRILGQDHDYISKEDLLYLRTPQKFALDKLRTVVEPTSANDGTDPNTV